MWKNYFWQILGVTLILLLTLNAFKSLVMNRHLFGVHRQYTIKLNTAMVNVTKMLNGYRSLVTAILLQFHSF